MEGMEMISINVSERWKKTFPGAHIGTLVVGNVDNSKRPTPLDGRKQEVEAELRDKYAGLARADLVTIDTLKAYRSYYKKFRKTYHVQLQLESIVHKGKALPDLSPLVDACFMTELETLILTAGHDADTLELPVNIEASTGTETLVGMNKNKITLKPDDMIMSDEKGVICTVIYGQDRRTLISVKTRRALYVAYVPAGIEKTALYDHLQKIKDYVFLFAPDATLEHLEVYGAPLLL